MYLCAREDGVLCARGDSELCARGDGVLCARVRVSLPMCTHLTYIEY